MRGLTSIAQIRTLSTFVNRGALRTAGSFTYVDALTLDVITVVITAPYLWVHTRDRSNYSKRLTVFR